MKRDEWYNSPEFVRHRFLNNLASDITHRTQQFNDALALLVEANPEIIFTDRYAIVERQSRIVRLEADKLWTGVRKLLETVAPKEFDKED
jgi:hypothetical protein